MKRRLNKTNTVRKIEPPAGYLIPSPGDPSQAATLGYGPADTDQESGLPVQEYLAIFRRRKAIALETFAVAVIMGLLITHFTKPVYRATAKLEVETSGYGIANTDTSNPLSSLFVIGRQQPVDTQLEILRTDSLLKRVQQSVGKVDFSSDIVGSTNIIELSGEANDPRRAVLGVNTLVDTYIADLMTREGSEITKAKSFVIAQESVTRQRLARAQEALRRFKEQNHIVEIVASRNDQITRVDQLQTDLNNNNLQLGTMNEQLAQLMSWRRGEPVSSRQTVLATNPNIGTIRNSIASLQVQREGMTQPGGFTSSAPQVRAIDAQIDQLRSQLSSQPGLVGSATVRPSDTYQSLSQKIGDTKVQIAMLENRARGLTTDLSQARQVLASFPNIESQFSRLTQEVDEAGAADKMFASQLQDLSLREKAQHVPVHVVEAAQIPTLPVRPLLIHNLLLSCAVGLMLGLLLALVWEYADDRIHRTSDAEAQLNIPALGEIRWVKPGRPMLLPALSPLDPMVESYRIIRTSMEFASVDRAIRSILVTSSTPGEGKSTVAANLAFAMAMDGRSVILVDADLRRPNLHRVLHRRKSSGLTDVMIDKVALEDVLTPYPGELNIRLLSSGTVPPNPSEMLGSNKFENLLKQLEAMCDLVIVNSSPLLVFSDPRRIASLVDGVLLVVEADATSRNEAKQGMQLLRQSRANPIGLVINKVTSPDGVTHDMYFHGYAEPVGELPESAEPAAYSAVVSEEA